MEAEVLIHFSEVMRMICPSCSHEGEMAYSVLSNSLTCLESECGFELEMNPIEAHEVLETEEELVCC
jgi:hypothetical protein